MTKRKPDAIKWPEYSEEWAINFCSEIASGISMREICRRPNSPCTRTIFTWLYKIPQFEAMYRIAKTAAMDAVGEELLEIADDTRDDWKYRDGHLVVNKEAIARSRLRCDTRQWLMSRIAPKKFGLKMPEQTEPFKFAIDKKDENM